MVKTRLPVLLHRNRQLPENLAQILIAVPRNQSERLCGVAGDMVAIVQADSGGAGPEGGGP